MNWSGNAAAIGVAVHVLIELVVIVRILLRPHRQPASRIAWVVVVTSLPVIGILAYLLFGETSIGRRRLARRREIIGDISHLATATSDDADELEATLPERYTELFRVGQSISFMAPVGGNAVQLLADSNSAINAMVADIDAAESHVHVLFYIWLQDTNGCKVIEALQRASRRGVMCRAMADDLGSRVLIRSPNWRALQDAGVHVAAALPIGNPLLRPFRGRIDLRNHRKIVVVDGRVTYCGSQNCADPEFRIKARYAPWVDILLRIEGPLALQNQHLFVADWMSHVDEDLTGMLKQSVPPQQDEMIGQVIGTGPTVRYSAMPELFESLMYAARHELVITTPYFVPDESMQNALCATAYRGVDTTIVFPARNDSRVVAAASRSYYPDLMAAGVKVYEYVGGLLHSKTLTVDGEVTLVGSANMDRRSFDLNYENNMLFCNVRLTADVRRRQQEYLDHSRRVRDKEVAAWPVRQRLWNNTIAMLGPLL